MSYLNGFLNDVEIPMSNSFIEGLLGEIGAMDDSNPLKAQAIVKLKRRVQNGITPTNTLTAKGEFESRISLLPANIIAELQAGKLQIVDKIIYTNKRVDVSTGAELMVNSDVSVVGLTNINARKLEANQYFLLTEVVLLSGVNTDVKATTFGIAVPNILNGEFEMAIGSKLIVPRISCQVFNTANRVNGFMGSYKLANPKLIPPQTEIKPEVWCPLPNAVNTNIAILLIGAILEKN